MKRKKKLKKLTVQPSEFGVSIEWPSACFDEVLSTLKSAQNRVMDYMSRQAFLRLDHGANLHNEAVADCPVCFPPPPVDYDTEDYCDACGSYLGSDEE